MEAGTWYLALPSTLSPGQLHRVCKALGCSVPVLPTKDLNKRPRFGNVALIAWLTERGIFVYLLVLLLLQAVTGSLQAVFL